MKYGQKYNLKEGDKIKNSEIIFIKELPQISSTTGRGRRISLFECYCGKLFETRLSSIITGSTQSCGCYCSKRTRDVNTKHGMAHDSLYKVWTQMKERILNPNTKGYENYGARGITMFPPWQVDFQLFFEYISALPNFKEKGYTIDRRNNNGNYEPGNLRWVTRNIQNRNMRKKKNNTSGYTGVSRFRDKWQSFIGGKHLGHFRTKEQGVVARNNYIIANNLTEYKIQEVR